MVHCDSREEKKIYKSLFNNIKHLTLVVVVFKFSYIYKGVIIKGLNNLGLNLLREWLLTNH